MFKCTHCEEEYGSIYTCLDTDRNITGRLLGLRIYEDDVCPKCGDGVLRPVKGESSVCP